MRSIKILAMVGGISQQSLNQKLYRAFVDVAGGDAEFTRADISRFPYFSQDLEYDPPDVITQFKDQIRHTDAVLFITPEYNRSIPGVLKNAIDWASRPYRQNLWNGIPAGIVGASIGNIGTFGAQHQLRQILSYLDMVTMNQPEFYLNASAAFDGGGKLINPEIHKLVEEFWTAFKNWIYDYGLRDEAVVPLFNSKGVEDNPDVHH